MSNKRDMTVGNPVKIILTFAIPLFIGNIFQQIYTVVDTMVAGHFLGDSAIAAIGATGALYGLIINLVWGLNSGFAIIITQRFGAKDLAGLKKSIAATAILDISFTVALTAIALVFLKPLMVLLNTPDSVFAQSYSYMFVICAGMLGTILYDMFSAIMRSLGNSRTPLYVLIFCSILNVVLDILFVASFKMGVAGAALATIVSQIASGFISGIYVLKNYAELLPSFAKKEDMPDAGLIKEMLTTGGAMSLMYSIVNVGSVIFQGATNTLGETIITAHTAGERIIGILMGPTSTIMDASATFVGQNWGAGKVTRIKDSLKKTMLMELIWGIIATAIVYIFGGAIIQLMTGTKNPEIINLAVTNMRIVLPFFPVLGVLLVQRTALQAMGQKVAPILSSVVEVLLRAFGAFVMVPHMGYMGVILNTPLTWTTMTIFILLASVKFTKVSFRKPEAMLC